MSFPLTLGSEGSFWGSGPGFDIGDVYGPNSALCRTLGIGCGGGNLPAPTVPSYPGYGYGPGPSFGDVIGGGSTMPQQGGGCAGSPFRAGASMAARASVFMLPNPITGRPVWFGPLGRPLLWSGDLSACRRVSRVASRAGRYTKRRSTRRRRSGGR